MSTQKEREPVPETTPIARSALIGPTTVTRVDGGWELPEHRGSGDVAVADLSFVTKVLVRAPLLGDVDVIMGTRFGRAAWDRDRLVTGAAPGEWLVLAPSSTAAPTVEHYRSALAGVTEELTTVMDLSHGRALMRVRGEATLDLLRRLTAFDLDDRFVPQGAALRTSVARVVTDVVRDDIDGRPSYLLHCERSSGRYLLESMLAAGADLGAELEGGQTSWPDHPTRRDTTS